jgi:hypothetical protein
MTFTRSQVFALGLSGATAFGIGICILAAPHAFHATYGTDLGRDPNLLSELRASGAGLAAFGLVILAGFRWTALRSVSIAVALIVYLAFPAGRAVGLVADGLPSAGILAALAIELAMAALLLFVFRPRVPATTEGGRRARVAIE